jgi:hypothetical protein
MSMTLVVTASWIYIDLGETVLNLLPVSNLVGSVNDAIAIICRRDHDSDGQQ